MTNASNTQWEVAGGKKNALKKVDLNGASNKLSNGKASTNKDYVSKIPKLSTQPPIKTENSIYDLIRESSDDESDLENKKKPKQQLKQTTSSAPVSPRQTQPKKDQSQEQPLNLLKTSIVTSQKKTIKPPASPKKTQTDLETALSQLNFENIQMEYVRLEKLFQENQAGIVSNLAVITNQLLNNVPDIEPSYGSEPYLTKLDKKIEKFFNNLINKLKRADSESVFDFCMNAIFADNPKVLSHHGFIMFIQLLLRQTPNLLANNYSKCIDLINTNRHRYQRVLIALRALSQVGYTSLCDGIKLWFEIMLPLISIKSCSHFIATYLYYLFEHHKSNVSKLTSKQSVIDCDQYLEFYDLVNDKSLVLNKDSLSKFKSSFQQIRTIFYQSLTTSEYFEPILANLENETSARQTENLDILTKIVFLNRDALGKWRKIYSKKILQSTIFLEHLVRNNQKNLKCLKEMRETLYYFDEQTSQQLKQASTSSSSTAKESTKQHHFHNKKTQKTSASQMELDRLRAFNQLVKQLIKQNFKRTSFLSMGLRSLFLIALLIVGFFYWDVNHNKSVYVNSIEKELKRLDLLEPTQKLITSVRNLFTKGRNLVVYYVPIWYNKAVLTIGPFTSKAYNQTLEYSYQAWTKSEPYRDMAQVYYEQSRKYIQKNFPIFLENVLNFINLVLEKVEIAFNLAVSYFNQGKDLIEVKMGMRKGEIDSIFFDAVKVVLDKITLGVQWLNENLTNVY